MRRRPPLMQIKVGKDRWDKNSGFQFGIAFSPLILCVWFCNGWFGTTRYLQEGGVIHG